jgi:hypothetical protein
MLYQTNSRFFLKTLLLLLLGQAVTLLLAHCWPASEQAA